jgi:hypothetical protein
MSADNHDSGRKDNQLLRAAHAIQRDLKLSIRAAATIYEVDRKTLRQRKHDRPSRCHTTSKPRELTDLEESTIVQYVLGLDSRALLPRPAGVEDIANRLRRNRGARAVGKNWASNFVRRQPALRTRFNRRRDYWRIPCKDPEPIAMWSQLLQRTLTKYGIAEEDI